MTPRPRPLPPRLGRKARAQRLEAGELEQRLAPLAAEAVEIGAALGSSQGDEVLVGQAQAVELHARNLLVIDQVAAACRLEVDPGGSRTGKFRNGVEVDVERIEK